MTIFGLEMMVKSGLNFFILKLNEPLQSCCCPVQKNWPRKAELAWLVSRYHWRGSFNFKIKKLDQFSPSFLSKKMVISRVKSLVHLQNEFQVVCIQLIFFHVCIIFGLFKGNSYTICSCLSKKRTAISVKFWSWCTYF